MDQDPVDRSTWWTWLAAGFVTIGAGLLGAGNAAPGEPAGAVVGKTLGGIALGQIVVCLFGVLTATSEYGTGSIRSTFTALPRRPRLLVAKALVVLAVSTVLGTLILVSTLLAGSLMLAPGVAEPSLADASVLRAVLGGGCYLGLLGVFSLALGLVLRATAGGITAATSITFILPNMLALVGETGEVLNKWWPTVAGAQILQLMPTHGDLAPLPGFGYFALITVITFAGAVALTERRDA
ncbi:ABC transporter permease [Streptomyces sp. NPDC048637]|uniref:ABC transporter permease n=1 Tax=Streptomyces sp. NPDC048637 TaxID=3155636 RepID=UPI00344ADC94